MAFLDLDVVDEFPGVGHSLVQPDQLKGQQIVLGIEGSRDFDMVPVLDCQQEYELDLASIIFRPDCPVEGFNVEYFQGGRVHDGVGDLSVESDHLAVQVDRFLLVGGDDEVKSEDAAGPGLSKEDRVVRLVVQYLDDVG